MFHLFAFLQPLTCRWIVKICLHRRADIAYQHATTLTKNYLSSLAFKNTEKYFIGCVAVIILQGGASAMLDDFCWEGHEHCRLRAYETRTCIWRCLTPGGVLCRASIHTYLYILRFSGGIGVGYCARCCEKRPQKVPTVPTTPIIIRPKAALGFLGSSPTTITFKVF